MERDKVDKAAPGPDSGAAQSNTRFTSPLVINSASRRKSLFSRPNPTQDAPRPGSSGSVSDASVASANNSKIPRLSQRRPFTLSDAYRLAEEEEAAQGSPSPAPRLWRSRRESSERKRITKTGSLGVPDTPRHGGLAARSLEPKRNGSHDERPASSHRSDQSDSTFDEKLRQYALDQTDPEEPGRRSNGLLSRSRLGTRILESGKEFLVRKPSRSSLENTPSPRPAKNTTNSPSFLRRLSGRRHEPSDASPARRSTDWVRAAPDADNQSLRPSTSPRAERGAVMPDLETPNRSFAWQADADFTAGDLQVSDSPPLAVGRSNTKIDRIRALEAEVNARVFESRDDQPKDARTDDIPALKSGDTPNVAHDLLETDKGISDAPMEEPEEEARAAKQLPLGQESTRTDSVRSREIERLSRRALATARLDEFRERSIGTSRSPSPDIARKPGGEPVRAFSPLRDRLRRQDIEAPVTTRHAKEGRPGQSALASTHVPRDRPTSETADAGPDSGIDASQVSGRSSAQTMHEPNELLSHLAPATGSNPSETEAVVDIQAPATRDRRLAERARQRRSIGGAKTDARPTVGFAGLSRSSSADSRVAKRASFGHSDSDPTERIEGEMKLFAAQENQSERGSLRAPSPEPGDEQLDETPKPIKIDPLTQPTPRVTGAFVETPATVKVEKPEGSVTEPVLEHKNTGLRQDGSRRLSSDSGEGFQPMLAPVGGIGITTRQQKRAHSSRGDRSTVRSSSISARRRARSLSRGRTPLTNSARPPTVKDDLLAIQRANQIDDSTLDDIADLLSHQGHAGAFIGARDAKPEVDGSGKLDREKELETYDRMSRSLETGLLGIRSAKQGIEWLENKVAHADIKEHSQHTAHDGKVKGDPRSCPICQGAQPSADAAVTYIHLPLPRLWYRRPRFRFTLLGLSLFLLSLWYVAESSMCFRYCKPDYCYPGTSCDWSADDPVWGYAIPVKLDQWVAGGRGRALAHRLRPEVADWLADLWDAATGTDPTIVDTSRLTWEQKRQHRRRLAKMGLGQRFAERPEDEAVLSGWRSVRKATEMTQAAREMGYEIDQDENIGDDERL